MANQVEQPFYLTLFTNSTGVLTKELRMEHGKIVSDAPKMVTGIAKRVQLTLSHFLIYDNPLLLVLTSRA